MVTDAVVSHWSNEATNIDGMPVLRTAFMMRVGDYDYAVKVDHFDTTITVECRDVKDPESVPGGFHQDDDYLGSLQQLSDAVAQAYDECIDNRA